MTKYSANWLKVILDSKSTEGTEECHSSDDAFKLILFNESCGIGVQISLKMVLSVSVNNEPASVYIKAWH